MLLLRRLKMLLLLLLYCDGTCSVAAAAKFIVEEIAKRHIGVGLRSLRLRLIDQRGDDGIGGAGCNALSLCTSNNNARLSGQHQLRQLLLLRALWYAQTSQSCNII